MNSCAASKLIEDPAGSHLKGFDDFAGLLCGNLLLSMEDAVFHDLTENMNERTWYSLLWCEMNQEKIV